MSDARSCAYTGVVFHERFAPKRHKFTYRVFSLCLDVDGIDALSNSLKFFSRNRFNVLSFHDRDFGGGENEPAGARARALLAQAGLGEFGKRIFLLCYPRLLGLAFNPLSVYFCHGGGERPGAVIYEVSNTFGERKSYVIAVDPLGPRAIEQGCVKELYVSPFTSPQGRYAFHVQAPGDNVHVGVNFIGAGGPVLNTYFRGKRLALSDRAIAGLVLRYPLMTLKVVAGIHFEALRLWWKGVPLIQRHVSPRYSHTIVPVSPRDPSHAE